MAEELTEEERARMRSLVALQKVVLGIVLRWLWLFIVVFCAFATVLGGILWSRGAKSVNRYTAKTVLMYTPKKVSHIDNMGDKQLMTVLERSSIKRRIAEKVKMDQAEGTCLTVDMKIEQGKRQGNLFKLSSASKTFDGAVAKVNAYAELLIDEYVTFRSRDLEGWRKSLDDRRKGLVAKLGDLEAEESALKAQTGGLTPSEALIAMNKLISDQRKNDSALGVDTANEEIKKRKLEASVGSNGPAIMENAPAIRRRVSAIEAIDTELVSLREKYTDMNPRVKGKLEERDERVKELDEFLKSKGAAGLDLEKIDMIEKAAAELAECVTRLEAIAEKRLALSKEIKDSEKRASELSGTLMEYERLIATKNDISSSIHEVDEQLAGISYAIGSMKNDLRQIEQAKGSSDNGPFGVKRLVIVIVGSGAGAGGVLLVIVLLELLFGKVRGGREIMAYDGIAFLGSLPKTEGMTENEKREAMGVVALKALLAGKGSKTMFVCMLPGSVRDEAFAEALDFTASLSGASCFFLDVVASEGFKHPDGAEEMIGIVRSGNHGWYPVANRFALAPTELELLKADLATLEGESFENVFIRVGSDMHLGGTFIDQLIELSSAVILMVGDGATPRRTFAYARRRLKDSGKSVMAIATGSSAKKVRSEMEVMS